MTELSYLDPDRMAAVDEAAFQNAAPYPWLNPAGLLQEHAYQTLLAELPSIELFTPSFGKARKHGQRSHDRYSLEYSPDLPIADAWHEFIGELKSDAYRGFLARLIGNNHFDIRFHWHYTPSGCEVSPHCDAKWKLGSHIFYFNTAEDWDPAWGGETVILDDEGRFSERSAPEFSDFPRAMDSESVGNHRLLFIRNGRSWHGVRELTCPDGYMRRVFIVVIRRRSLGERLRRRVA